MREKIEQDRANKIRLSTRWGKLKSSSPTRCFVRLLMVHFTLVYNAVHDYLVALKKVVTQVVKPT